MMFEPNARHAIGVPVGAAKAHVAAIGAPALSDAINAEPAALQASSAAGVVTGTASIPDTLPQGSVLCVRLSLRSDHQPEPPSQ